MTHLFTLCLAIILTACSAVGTKKGDTDTSLPREGITGNPLQAPSESAGARSQDLTYVVKPDDILSAIAQKTTGNGENWRTIALFNGIEDPSQLRVNDVVMIPGHLLKPELDKRPQESGTAITQVATVDIDGVDAKEVDPSDLQRTPQTSPNMPSYIVDGSYYPKAIYRQPGYTGGLLARVSPGTPLQMIDQSGEWMTVKTDKGTGYIHQSDVRQVEGVDANSSHTF